MAFWIFLFLDQTHKVRSGFSIFLYLLFLLLPLTILNKLYLSRNWCPVSLGIQGALFWSFRLSPAGSNSGVGWSFQREGSFPKGLWSLLPPGCLAFRVSTSKTAAQDSRLGPRCLFYHPPSRCSRKEQTPGKQIAVHFQCKATCSPSGNYQARALRLPLQAQLARSRLEAHARSS